MILLPNLKECLHMLQMLHSTIQPVHNGIVIVYVAAYKLSLCMQSGSDACNIQLS